MNPFQIFIVGETVTVYKLDDQQTADQLPGIPAGAAYASFEDAAEAARLVADMTGFPLADLKNPDHHQQEDKRFRYSQVSIADSIYLAETVRQSVLGAPTTMRMVYELLELIQRYTDVDVWGIPVNDFDQFAADFWEGFGRYVADRAKGLL